jgi:hypothetical protein
LPSDRAPNGHAVERLELFILPGLAAPGFSRYVGLPVALQRTLEAHLTDGSRRIANGKIVVIPLSPKWRILIA